MMCILHTTRAPARDVLLSSFDPTSLRADTRGILTPTNRSAMTPASALAPDSTVVVIGAGRLGRVLARALTDAGFVVTGPLARDAAIPDTDIALLCVPDAAIPDAAAAARPHARLVGHVSGATGLADVDFSIHPLQTFTGIEEPNVFRGIGAAIDGHTPEAQAAGEHLARALGAEPFAVHDVNRAAYHAAAAFASNLLLAVLDASENLAASIGIRDPRALFAPLVTQTVQNWQRAGASEALTGPIVRGDEATIARQRSAVAASAPRLVTVFDALVESTRALKERP